MTVNFWCGFVAFMAVCFGFVLLFVYDSQAASRKQCLNGY